MKEEHDHENCNCEHHQPDVEGNVQQEMTKCPTEMWADNIIEYLKKEFDKQSKD